MLSFDYLLVDRLPQSGSASAVAGARNSFSCLCLDSWLVLEHWADHRQGAATAATFEVVPEPHS